MDFNVIKSKMDADDIQISLFFKSSNIYYLSGFKPSSFSMVVFNDEPVLFASKMDLEEANNISKIPVEEFKSFKQIKEFLQNSVPKKIGLESTLSLGICKKIRGDWKITLSDIVDKQRMIKTPLEIKNIEKANEIAEKSIKSLKVQGKEWEVAEKLNHEMKINGSQKEAFDTIVASGSRSSLPHAASFEK